MQKSSTFFLSIACGLGLIGCAEDTTDASVQLVYDNNTNLTTFIANHGATSLRIWYSFDNLVTSEGSGANIIQPSTAKPTVLPQTSTTPSVTDWSVSTGGGTSFSSGDTVTLTGLPLGQTGLKFAVEILQQLSDGQLHPVAYAYYNYGAESANADQLKADLSQPRTIVAGRTCGSLDKAQTFKGALTDSQFIAHCP